MTCVLHQVNQPTAGFFARCITYPEKRLVDTYEVMMLMIKKQWPFTEHAMECAYNKEAYDNSAWKGKGIAQETMRASLEAADNLRSAKGLKRWRIAQAEKARRREPDDASRTLPTSSHVALAVRLNLTTTQLMTALETTHTPRLTSEEESVVEWLANHPKLPVDSIEGRTAVLATAQLVGGVCESKLMAILTCNEFDDSNQLQKERVAMEDDLRREKDARAGTGAYVPGPPGSTQGERVAQALENKSEYAARPLEERAIMRAARSFFQHESWNVLASERTVTSALVRGDLAPYSAAVAAREDELMASKSKLPLQRRRFQGQGSVNSVLACLRKMEWDKCTQGSSWKSLQSALLACASGHGLADFLSDKIILDLLLGGVVSELDEGTFVTLGPGALTSLLCRVSFLQQPSQGFYSSFRVKPKDAASILSVTLDDGATPFSKSKYFELLRGLLPLGLLVYCRMRLKLTPCLTAVQTPLLAAVSARLANISLESEECETMRRRAAALAYQKELIKTLPKGQFLLSLIRGKAERTLHNMQHLQRIGTALSVILMKDLIKTLPEHSTFDSMIEAQAGAEGAHHCVALRQGSGHHTQQSHSSIQP